MSKVAGYTVIAMTVLYVFCWGILQTREHKMRQQEIEVTNRYITALSDLLVVEVEQKEMLKKLLRNIGRGDDDSLESEK